MTVVKGGFWVKNDRPVSFEMPLKWYNQIDFKFMWTAIWENFFQFISKLNF